MAVPLVMACFRCIPPLCGGVGAGSDGPTAAARAPSPEGHPRCHAPFSLAQSSSAGVRVLWRGVSRSTASPSAGGRAGGRLGLDLAYREPLQPGPCGGRPRPSRWTLAFSRLDTLMLLHLQAPATSRPAEGRQGHVPRTAAALEEDITQEDCLLLTQACSSGAPCLWGTGPAGGSALGGIGPDPLCSIEV